MVLCEGRLGWGGFPCDKEHRNTRVRRSVSTYSDEPAKVPSRLGSLSPALVGIQDVFQYDISMSPSPSGIVEPRIWLCAEPRPYRSEHALHSRSL